MKTRSARFGWLPLLRQNYGNTHSIRTSTLSETVDQEQEKKKLEQLFRKQQIKNRKKEKKNLEQLFRKQQIKNRKKKKLEQQLFRINSRSTTTRKLEQQQIKTLWRIKKTDEKKRGGRDLPTIQSSRSSNLPDDPRTRKKKQKKKKESWFLCSF